MYFLAKRKHQMIMDKVTPLGQCRWTVLAVTLLLFLVRMYLKQGYAVVAYLLGLTYINHVFLFLSPAEDPEEAERE